MSGVKDLTARVIAYENGEMDEAEALAFFQDLINSGLVWKLQGSYGRSAIHLIQSGKCLPSRDLLMAYGTFRGSTGLGTVKAPTKTEEWEFEGRTYIARSTGPGDDLKWTVEEKTR